MEEIYVLPPLYNPKPRQWFVSAGPIVFVLDKKPAVQSLFPKTEFQHCHRFPFKRIPLHFISVYQQRRENPNQTCYIVVLACLWTQARDGEGGWE